MSLHWYACISMSTYYYIIYHISLEMIWWALFKASLIVQICPVIHEILKNKDFIVTDDLISQLFVVTFVYPTYVQIALIWGFTVQLSLWKSVHWLWRYKLNKVCNTYSNTLVSVILASIITFSNLFDQVTYSDATHKSKAEVIQKSVFCTSWISLSTWSTYYTPYYTPYMF